MLTPSLVNARGLRSKEDRSPEHWLERAKQARLEAKQLHDRECQAAILAIAAGYERMAHAVSRLRRALPPDRKHEPW